MSLLGIFLVNLLLKYASFSSSICTTNKSGITIEMPSDFLERGVLSLDVEEPYKNEFEAEPCTVYDVVLPSNVVQGDGVDVGVEKESEIDHGEHIAHTLGTNAIGENLDSVSDQETRPSDVVEGVIQEDHGDDSTSVGLDLGGIITFGANGPNNEADHHASG
jgi:hypothetical protein